MDHLYVFFGECLFRFSAHCFHWVVFFFFFLILSCMSCLYTLEFNPLLAASFAILQLRWVELFIVYELLIAAPSLLRSTGSRQKGFNSCHTLAQRLKLRGPRAWSQYLLPSCMWNLPQPGFELVSCIGRQILHYWATKKALMLIFDWVLWHEYYFVGFWMFLYVYKHSWDFFLRCS